MMPGSCGGLPFLTLPCGRSLPPAVWPRLGPRTSLQSPLHVATRSGWLSLTHSPGANFGGCRCGWLHHAACLRLPLLCCLGPSYLTSSFRPSYFFSPKRSSVLHYTRPFSHPAGLPFYTLGPVPWLWRGTGGGERGDTGPALKECVFSREATPVTKSPQRSLLGTGTDVSAGPSGAGRAVRVHLGWPGACFAGESLGWSLGGWRGSCGPRWAGERRQR